MPRRKLESEFNKHLNKELDKRFPGQHSFKQDSEQMIGIPDRLVIYKDKWAMLESKRDAKAPYQPLQPERLEHFNDLSFASVIYPENCDEVLDALEDFFLDDSE